TSTPSRAGSSWPRRCRARTAPPARRPPSTTSVVRQSGSRRSSAGRRLFRFQIREPDLDERPDPLLQPGLPREGECLLPALPRLRRVDALLEAVVAGHEQLLDPLADALFHNATLTARMNGCRAARRSPSRSAC